MQISDLMGQYHKSPTGTERYSGTKGVESLVSSLRSLTKGNIFEGTVRSLKNGQVTLALANGQQLVARMDAKISLNVGESMFFQVKSNDGSQIAIRPFSVDGSGANYTLLQALSAAGLPQDAKHLSMVNRMMEEQMPIDRGSLQQMARVVAANEKINVQTLVQLQKLGIPVTVENASQFENYLDDRQAITASLDQLMEELPSTLSSELPEDGMRQAGARLLSVITEELPEISEGVNPRTVFEGEMDLPVTEGANVLSGNENADTAEVQGEVSVAADTETVDNEALMEKESAPEERVSHPAMYDRASQVKHTLGAVLEPEQLDNLNRMLGKLLGKETLSYSKDSGTVQVLKDLQQVLKDPLPVEHEQLSKLFSSEEFKALVKDTLEQQWLIKPSELEKEPDKVGKLYERMTDQISRMENAVRSVTPEHTDFAQTAAEIRNNVQFMDQVNHLYTYAQIPLKMSGQNASAELYVYTNRKALKQGDKDLTAFLHLDLDHLGSTDVSVRMHGREVSTSFYLEDDASYELIERNLPVLSAKLQKKGYQCTFTAVNEAKHVNFVEDFLKKDQPSAGQLHRYSFDVRA